METCGLDGCDKKRHARGWCDGHYQQWKRGVEMSPLQQRRTGCSFPECDRKHFAKGYCAAHNKQKREGKELAPIREARSGCAVDGCDKPHRSHGYCKLHATRYERHGDPEVCLHRTDDITYAGAHSRVRYRRGPARGYDCVDCTGTADDWSYNHADPNEKQGLVETKRGSYLLPYSTNPDNYEPRCKMCHKAFDLQQNANQQREVAR